jgi:hypothetical protein
MKESFASEGKFQSLLLFSRFCRFRSRFLAALMLAASLLVSGCDVLTRLGITPGDDDADKPAPVPVIFDTVTVDSAATTTSLVLVLDKDIPGLEKGNIALTSETLDPAEITVDGIFGDGTGTYILALSGVDKLGEADPGVPGVLRELGEIAVGVSRGGYAVSPASRPARVYYDEPVKNVKFERVTANGAADTTVTASLTLIFDEKIPGLSADNITIHAGSTGVKKGALSGDGPSYTLGISDVTAAGEITVIVNKSGYNISPVSQPVQIHYPLAKFNGVAADGAAGTTVTKSLVLTFDKDIAGLTANDITITAGSTGATKDSLSRTADGTYLLAVSVNAAGTITVGVNKNGCRIDPASKTVQVHYPAAAFKSGTANGAAGTSSTTSLTLTFDKSVPGLAADDITLGAGVTKGALSGSGPVYTLGVSGVTAAGEITVGVSKSGYSISPASKTVHIHGKGIPVTGQEGNSSIKAKFGITKAGAAGVKETFTALHEFIQSGGLAAKSGVIKKGNWIDLDGGLTVAAGSGGGGFSYDGDTAMQALTLRNAAHGTLCRLIVVGINSFNGKNGNNTPHVVFQFQNIPVERRMHHDASTGGYEKSEMRTYLTGNFLTGLQNAGVPDTVLWAPVRYVSKGPNGTNCAALSDKLWLPTEREMTRGGRRGSSGPFSPNSETAANQTLLDYYDGSDSTIIKVSKSNSAVVYWVASSYASLLGGYCGIDTSGFPFLLGTTSSQGVAPAFCVK